MRKRHALAIGLFAALVLAGCGKDQATPGAPGAGGQMPPPEVGVVTLQAGDVALTRDLVGRLAPFRSADVRARVAGVLLKRTYEEGTDVKEGQVPTVQGQALTVRTGAGVMVNQSKVLATDVQASNGVIHVIDTVLMPQ